MVNPVQNEIIVQARQGSVAAIIQILNESLADEGVRTRAVFNNKILELLCEAGTANQLDPSTLVAKIQAILENIAPRHVRRVHLYGRIAQEQQLLWLQAIHRDPENQLLWSESIILKRPSVGKQLVTWLRIGQTKHPKLLLPQGLEQSSSDKNASWSVVLVGIGMGLVLLFASWQLFKGQVSDKQASQSSEAGAPSSSSELPPGLPPESPPEVPSSGTPQPPSSVLPEERSSPSQTPSDEPSNVPPTPTVVPPPNTIATDSAKDSANGPTYASTKESADEAFVQAVRVAEKAWQEGKVANSESLWLDLATQWKKAADLMEKVPPNHPRFAIAQDRVGLYRQFSDEALRQANRFSTLQP